MTNLNSTNLGRLLLTQSLFLVSAISIHAETAAGSQWNPLPDSTVTRIAFEYALPQNEMDVGGQNK